MGKIKTYFQSRKASFYCMAAAIMLQLTMVCLYGMTGKTVFTSELSMKVIVFAVLFIIFGVALLVLNDVNIGKNSMKKFGIEVGNFVTYILALFAWTMFAGSETAYIGNVFVGIDGNTFTATFIATFLLGMLASLSALAAAILYTKKSKKERTADKMKTELETNGRGV